MKSKLIALIGMLFGFSSFAGPVPANFSQVDAGVYRGAMPQNAAEMQYLRGLGIRTMVNLQGGENFLVLFPSESKAGIDQERQAAQNAGMGFINVPFPAAGYITPRTEEKIRTLIQKMRDPSLQPLYIHCYVGYDRTSLIAALYRFCATGDRSGMRAGHFGATTVFTPTLDLFYHHAMSTPGWCLDPHLAQRM